MLTFPSGRFLGASDTVVRVLDVAELERLPSGKAWVVRRAFNPA